jgi:hypothetical protein
MKLAAHGLGVGHTPGRARSTHLVGLHVVMRRGIWEQGRRAARPLTVARWSFLPRYDVRAGAAQ